MLPALQPVTNTRRVGHPPEHPVEGGAGVGVAAVVDRDRRPAGRVGPDGVTGVDVAGAGGDEQHRPAPERVARVVQVEHARPERRVVAGVHVVVEEGRPARARPVVPAAAPALEEHQQPVRRPHPRPEREPPRGRNGSARPARPAPRSPARPPRPRPPAGGDPPASSGPAGRRPCTRPARPRRPPARPPARPWTRRPRPASPHRKPRLNRPPPARREEPPCPSPSAPRPASRP